VSPPLREAWPVRHSLQAADGDDSVNNVLILKVNGQFELRQGPPFNQLLNDPSVIVRHESFNAGNKYIGSEANADDKYIDDLFIDSLEYWKDHLKDGGNQNYSDTYASMSHEEIERELMGIRDNWVSNF